MATSLDPAAGLVAFRAALYACFGRRRDALFELTDALLSAHARPSLAHLSLAPLHRRGWGSVYAALRRGEVDEEALRELLAHNAVHASRRPSADGWAGPPLYAVDVSVWPRCNAATSPLRGYHYHSPRRRQFKPIVAGWAYQWVARLTWERDSWTVPVDARRLRPGEKATDLAVEQLKQLVARRPSDSHEAPPLVVFDAGYDVAAFTEALADIAVALLIRLRSTRCFFREPPARTPETVGRPRRHGAKFVCKDPATWPTPDAAFRTVDAAYGPVDVRAWADLNTYVRRPVRPGFRPTAAGSYRGPRPLTRGTVVRLHVGRLPGQRRKPEVIWLWWQPPPGSPSRGNPTSEDLALLWRAYARRYDLEQTFRFMKQTLEWVTPRVRLPEQADRWTWLVAAAYAQLRLARAAKSVRALARTAQRQALPPRRAPPTGEKGRLTARPAPHPHPIVPTTAPPAAAAQASTVKTPGAAC